jgi:hypothetical protein
MRNNIYIVLLCFVCQDSNAKLTCRKRASVFQVRINGVNLDQ